MTKYLIAAYAIYNEYVAPKFYAKGVLTAYIPVY